jgi:hypothetical protein
METTLSINLITTNPNVRGGRPCLAGTGLRVTDVVMAHLFHDQTPDEIASAYRISVCRSAGFCLCSAGVPIASTRKNSTTTSDNRLSVHAS